MRRWLLDILGDPASPIAPLLDLPAVRRLAVTGMAPDEPWFGQLMQGSQIVAYLIEIDTWLREYRVELDI